MAWDKSTPAGNTKISVGDNAIRDNQESIEDAFGGAPGNGGDLSGTPRPGEHQFSTGGNQSGRHIFKWGDAAAQAGLSTSGDDNGWVIMRTDVRSRRCWYYFNGVSWFPVDCGVEDLPRLDENTIFTASQRFDWELVAPVGTDLPLDFATQPAKYATVPAASSLNIENPINLPTAGDGSTYYLQLTNAGAGSSLTWESLYRSPNGIAPAFDSTSGAVNFYTLTVLPGGNILVTAASGVGTF